MTAVHPAGNLALVSACRPYSGAVQSITITAAAVITLAAVPTAPARAEPSACNDPSCVPGITGGVVLGAPCSDTTHYVFGTTSWGRLVFCGSPRRYGPRYFRSPSMQGIKDENSNCEGFENSVAQAPDGLFLTCLSVSGEPRWVRGDT